MKLSWSLADNDMYAVGVTAKTLVLRDNAAWGTGDAPDWKRWAMARIEMVNIGAQNYVVAGRVVAVLTSGTAPIRRVIREAKDKGTLLDVSQHRELRSLVVLDDGHLVASFLPSNTVVRRFADPSVTLDAQDADD